MYLVFFLLVIENVLFDIKNLFQSIFFFFSVKSIEDYGLKKMWEMTIRTKYIMDASSGRLERVNLQSLSGRKALFGVKSDWCSNNIELYHHTYLMIIFIIILSELVIYCSTFLVSERVQMYPRNVVFARSVWASMTFLSVV